VNGYGWWLCYVMGEASGQGAKPGRGADVMQQAPALAPAPAQAQAVVMARMDGCSVIPLHYLSLKAASRVSLSIPRRIISRFPFPTPHFPCTAQSLLLCVCTLPRQSQPRTRAGPTSRAEIGGRCDSSQSLEPAILRCPRPSFPAFPPASDSCSSAVRRPLPA
jgi:hypothetical protein